MLARTRRGLVALVVVLCAAASVADVADAATPTGTTTTPATAAEYAKYYIVTSAYQGKPETLPEIAGRFLRNPDRSQEILTLNAGVRQPDGGELTDPAVLDAGWVLVLPWDALGDGVQYGLPPLPAAQPGAPVSSAGAQQSAVPTKAPAPAATSAVSGCAGTPKPSGTDTNAQWAMLRIAPNRAWPYSQGQGVSVAVVDSGVDASVPELTSRVTQGSDIVGGTGRGDLDCLGSGTAMAGIIVGQADGAFGGGVAPDAKVLPVRIAVATSAVSVTDQASAIQVAVDGGAEVIALGALVDPTQPQVAAAIARAVSANVVVVTSALPPAAVQPAGVLRVGAIGIDGRAYGGYPAGAVDVVAPGVDVATLGISGTGQVLDTGGQYAVAFGAGVAALVRARHGDLTAAEVVRRIEATSDRIGAAAPDPTYGYGLLDPFVAVTRVIPDEGRGPAPAPTPVGHQTWSGRRVAALVASIVLALLLLSLLTLRIRSMVRADGARGVSGTESEAAAERDQLSAWRREPAPLAADQDRERATSTGDAASSASVSARQPGAEGEKERSGVATAAVPATQRLRTRRTEDVTLPEDRVPARRHGREDEE